MREFFGKKELKVYQHAAKKGMKLFTDSEINRASGYERLYRIFWNKKVDEVCSDRVLVKWTKTAIEGIVATEWTLKKTPLMNNHAQQLLRCEYPENAKRRQKRNTVGKNLDEMLHVHKRLLNLDSKLRCLREPSNTEKNKKEKIAGLETELKAKLAELKKNQECLRKSMENMAREKNVSNTDISTNMEVDTDKLNRDEIQLLLAQIEKENVNTSVVSHVTTDNYSGSDDDLLVGTGSISCTSHYEPQSPFALEHEMEYCDSASEVSQDMPARCNSDNEYEVSEAESATETSCSNPSATIPDIQPHSPHGYGQRQSHFPCSEGTDVGHGSFYHVTDSQTLEDDEFLQEILGELAEAVPVKKRKINN